LQEEKPTQWSQEEIEDHINSNSEFKSRKIAYLIKSGGSSINFGPSVPVTPPLALPVARDPARDITNLAKLYTGDQKYSGQDDNFDFHLTIFNNYCSQLGIQDDLTKAKAYSIMLKGLALDHYFTNLRNTDSNVNIPFNELCNTTRNYFETAEYRRSQLNKWNATTLRTVIADTKNVGKSTKECLQLLVAELRHLQPSLDSALRTDLFLHSKLITACQDVPACEYACFKPAESLSSLITDLQSSITTYEKTHPSDPSTSVFFTDRRFYCNQPRFLPSSPQLPSRLPSSRFPRPIQYKRCFVCQKEGY
jgi:hypothetical protein